MKKYNKKMLFGGLFALLILTFVGSYLFLAHLLNPEQAKPESAPSSYLTEQVGEQENINFTDKAAEIHAIVDELLTQHQGRLLDSFGERKSVSRRQTEGEFIWDSRSLDINMPAASLEGFAAALDAALSKAGARVLNRADDKRNGQAVVRLDVGIIDDVDGDTVTIITDRLFIPAASEPEPKKAAGRLAFVIDDFGYSKNIIQQYRKVDMPLTFAVLPYLPYTAEAAETGYADGRRIILHLPLEAQGSGVNTEKIVLGAAMNDEELRRQLIKMLAGVPHAIGVNNHQGSAATADTRVMRQLLTVLGERGYFFIDSRTSSRSVAFALAQQQGILSGENRLFIDNKSDINAIKAKIREAAELARREKSAIVIGHARPNTAEALLQMKPELAELGIEVVFATELLL